MRQSPRSAAHFLSMCHDMAPCEIQRPATATATPQRMGRWRMEFLNATPSIS